MGKEIIKPTPSLRLRLANVGLVVPLALGALPFINGCSQESSQPPKFPQTDTDRPLRGNQQAKKEVVIPTVIPTEKPIGQSWSHYVAPILPFELDYPSPWQVSSQTDSGLSLTVPLLNEVGGAAEVLHLETARTATEQWLKANEDNYKTKAVQIALKTQNGPKQPAWKLDSKNATMYIFLRNGLTWTLFFPHEYAPKEIEEKMMQSFILLDDAQATKKSTPAPKTPEGKIAISKKPKDLFRSLLTTPFPKDNLPPRIIPGDQTVSEPDATSKAFDPLGMVVVFFKFDEEFNNSLRFRIAGGFGGMIFYTVYPNSSDAKDAYRAMINKTNPTYPTSNKNGGTDSDYPEFLDIINNPYLAGITSIVTGTVVENVVIVINYGGPNLDSLRLNPADVTRAAVKHLQKVGR